MLRSITAALGLGLLALGPKLWIPQPTAHPESVSQIETGVWWVGQPNVGPALPPPGQVPAGGLWVSSTMAGTVAESAIRFTVGALDRQPIVTIPINTSTTPPAELPVNAGVNVQACPTTGKWTPPAKGTFGALSAAPAYNCGAGAVQGETSVDGKSMVFNLTQLVTDSNKTVSVLLVPGTVPPPIPPPPVALPVAVPNVFLPSTFDVTFKPVTAGAVEVLTSPPPDAASDDALGVNPSAYAAPADASSSATPTTRAATSTAPRRVTRPRGVAALPGQAAQIAASVTRKGTSPRERTIAGVIFFDLCLWGWWMYAKEGVAPGARPYRTLYDSIVATPKTRSRREGSPPPLR